MQSKNAISNKTYGLRNIATGEKIDCSCGYHGTTKNYEEAAADEPCAAAQSGNNGGAQDNNHQPQHKSTTVPNPPPAKIYTNTMFTDSNGNPIPYCDSDDPPNPDDGKRIMNDEIERDFGQWLRKRKA
jgi:hypothetical protein